MIGTHFSTLAESPEVRTEAWNSVVGRYFGKLHACCEDAESFEANLSRYDLGPLPVFRISAPIHQVERSSSALQDHGSDYYKLVLQMSGSSMLEQRGQTVLLQPGDWSVYDPKVPYRISNQCRIEQLAIQIPRPHLRGFFSSELLTSVSSAFETRGLFALVSSFLGALSNQLPLLPVNAEAALSETVICLLANTLGVQQDAQGKSVAHHVIMRSRVKQYIEQRLADADLSIDQIAGSLNCSKRYLHQVFEDEGVSIDRYIWQCRLERCKDALDRSQVAKAPIAEIAFRWGFSSSAHFCRRFKHRYGLTPGEFLRNRSSKKGSKS